MADEYRSPNSSIGHFSIILVPKCRPADMPTYSPVYCFHFLLIQVLTCLPARWIRSSTEHFYWALYISASSKCQSADLPTTSTCVAHNFLYSVELFLGVLISIGVLMWLSQIPDGGFDGKLYSPSFYSVFTEGKMSCTLRHVERCPILALGVCRSKLKVSIIGITIHLL